MDIGIKDPVFVELNRLISERGSQKSCAEMLGISPAYLSDILSGKRNVSSRILEKLGYVKIIVHVKNDNALSVIQAIENAAATT